jgi:hypothetical protein
MTALKYEKALKGIENRELNNATFIQIDIQLNFAICTE